MKIVDFDESTSFLDHVYLGCTQRDGKPNEIVSEEKRKMFESRISAGATKKLPGRQKHLTHKLSRGHTIWKDMLENALCGSFQDSDCAADLEDSKSTLGGILCIFGSRTYVPINWT